MGGGGSRRGLRRGRAQGPARRSREKGRSGRRRRLAGAPGRGTLEKDKPPILGLIQRGGQLVIRMLANVQQMTIQPVITATVTPDSLIHTDEYDIYARLPAWGYRRRSAMAAASMPATRTATASARYTSTPWRVSGHCSAPGCVRIAASRKRSCQSTSASLSSCTTRAGAEKPCSVPLSLPWSGDVLHHPGSRQEPLAHAWAKKGADLRVPAPGQAVKMAMLGVLDWATRELLVHTSRTKRSSDFIDLLSELGRRYGPRPGMISTPVVLVLDKGPIHTSKASRAALAARAHWLTVEWLPKYAPELNDIEDVWRDVKRHHLAHQTFASADDLDRGIHQAVADLNQERMHHPLDRQQRSA